MLDCAENALANPGAELPVLVPLGGYDGRSEIFDLTRRELERAILEHEMRRQGLPAHCRLAKRLEEELAGGKLAIFFDGLNEIPPDVSLPAMKRLAEFRRNHPGNRFVFSCRVADYLHSLPVTEIHVQPLEDSRIRQFIESRIPEGATKLLNELHSDRPRRLFALCRNPYLLELMIYIFGERGSLPSNRADLFSEFVGSLLRREHFAHHDWWKPARANPAKFQARWAPLLEWSAHPEVFGLDDLDEAERNSFLEACDELVEALARLAYGMAASGTWGTAVPEHAAAEFLGMSASWVDRGIGASLLERSPAGIRFSHQLLQEYFAAAQLAGLSVDESHEWLAHDAWDETIALLAGMTEKPADLIDTALRLDPMFAAHCASACADSLTDDSARRLVDTLVAIAGDMYDPSRFSAIEALGASRLRQAVPALVALLDRGCNQIPLLLKALGETGRPEAFQHLLGWLDDQSSFIREKSASALGKLGDARAVPVLLEQLRSGSKEPSWPLAAALEQLCSPTDAAALLRILSEETGGIMCAAARVLGTLRVREAIPAILDNLSSAKDEEREILAHALGKLRATEALPALMEQMRHRGRNFRVPSSAAEAISAIKEPSWIPMFRDWVRDGSDDFRAVAACRALVELGAREAVPDFVLELRSAHPARRRAALEAVTALQAREATPVLIEMYDAADSYERSKIAPALKQLQTREMIPNVVDRMRRASETLPAPNMPDSVLTLGGMLQELWNSSDIPHLLEFLDPSEGWGLRWAASRTLGQLKACVATPKLTQALRDEVDAVRAEAARALGLLGAQEAIPELERSLALEQGWNRDMAVEALIRIMGPGAASELIGPLADGSTGVRWHLVPALANSDPANATALWIVRLLWEGDSFGSVERDFAAFPDEAIDVLQPFLGHPDWWVRWHIAPIYERIRKGAGRARPDRTLWRPSARAALQAAVVISNRALRLLPTWDVAILVAADAHRRLGHPELCNLRLDGGGTEPRFNVVRNLTRARSLLDLEQREDALALLNHLCLGNQTADNLAAMACLFERAGDLARAEELYDRAIDIARPYAFHRHRAAFLIREQRFREAEADCRRAAELEQLDSSSNIASAEKVRRFFPDQERQVGLLLLAQGRLEEAIREFEAAGKREPSGLWRYDHALASLAAGQNSGAAWNAIDKALGSMELTEQIIAAQADFDLLARAIPDLSSLSELRVRIVQAAALVRS